MEAESENNKMKILFEVSSEHAAGVLIPLVSACSRNAVHWCCFFTNGGVKNLSNEDVIEVIAGAVKAVVCEVSWERYMGDHPCPIKLGSQTDNSALAGDAEKIISL